VEAASKTKQNTVETASKTKQNTVETTSKTKQNKTRWKPLPKNMPSPALYTNFEIPSSKPCAFPPHPVLPTSKYKKQPQEGLCGKRAKAARKFVTIS